MISIYYALYLMDFEAAAGAKLFSGAFELSLGHRGINITNPDFLHSSTEYNRDENPSHWNG